MPGKKEKPAKQDKAPKKKSNAPVKKAAPAKGKVKAGEDPDAGLEEAFEASDSNKKCVAGKSKVREQLEKKQK